MKVKQLHDLLESYIDEEEVVFVDSGNSSILRSINYISIHQPTGKIMLQHLEKKEVENDTKNI